MENLVEITIESRKEWAAPELKKIDVEEITAANFVAETDNILSGSTS